MTEIQLKSDIVEYFKDRIFEPHIEASLRKHTRLRSYNINPIVVKYLSQVLENQYSPIGVAKALFLPRVLGTSINTSFGTQIQNMFVSLNIASGSMIPGMDIEFVDKVDNRKKWCQLKAGPNTINSGDVKPLTDKFANTINLARTNLALAGIRNTDFIVGVLYGKDSDLSQHYRRIDSIYPVYVGSDFWYRVTGFPSIYDGLVVELHKMIQTLDTQDFINTGVKTLATEIKASPLFEF